MSGCRRLRGHPDHAAAPFVLAEGGGPRGRLRIPPNSDPEQLRAGDARYPRKALLVVVVPSSPLAQLAGPMGGLGEPIPVAAPPTFPLSPFPTCHDVPISRPDSTSRQSDTSPDPPLVPFALQRSWISDSPPL